MTGSALANRLARGVPFHYGWVILVCVMFACLSRAGPAVATLSMFVQPMTAEFGWSRTAMSGAVSVGGILAAIFSPMIGAYLDRAGARLVLGLAVLATGSTLMLLSTVHSLVAFYLLYCVARMCWAGPYDLGIHGALSNWFVRRRATVASISAFTQTLGIVAMPFIAYAVMAAHGWRQAWLVIGALVLVLGFLPSWLLMIRRPEDVGLVPDGLLKPEAPPAASAAGAPPGDASVGAPPPPEPAFTRAEALGTRAFWTLALFTALIYPVQAGMSLHQAAHLVERGLSPAGAATAVSIFSAASAVAGLSTALVRRWLSVKVSLAFSAGLLVASALTMISVASPAHGILSGVLFGLGIGSVHVILPVAWADYFGRRSFGAIRGVALSVQVAAQAAGPLLSGLLRDFTGDYTASLLCFATLSGLGALAALLTRAPEPQTPPPPPASSPVA